MLPQQHGARSGQIALPSLPLAAVGTEAVVLSGTGLTQLITDNGFTNCACVGVTQ